MTTFQVTFNTLQLVKVYDIIRKKCHFSIQTSCVVLNSGISLAGYSVLIALMASFPLSQHFMNLKR